MDSLVGYGSDDEIETERYGLQLSVGAGSGRRREDDTNYDSVNMDMSEESQGAASETELQELQAGGRATRPSPRGDSRKSNDSRESERDRDHQRSRERERRRDERRSPRRDERTNRKMVEEHRSERGDRRPHESRRRGLLGDRPDDRPLNRPDAKHGGGEGNWARSQDARDAASPRFMERDRTDRRERERERERDSRPRRSEERRSGRDRRGERSRSRGAAYPPPPQSSNDRRSSPNGDYRPSSYKVNKKLEVMEKMGLQIKTPDGSMATAQQLRAAAGDAPRGVPALGGPGARVLQQVQKRKLLWANKNKTETEAAKWSGTKFAQDSDGKQVSKFMRLMGIKDPAAVPSETPMTSADPNKKQEELFQAMQAQYDVARATTHTMRGVGLGFQRGQF